MDNELINAFVVKQRDALNDLMSKSIMLEARLQVAEDRLGKYQETVNGLEQQVRDALAERDKLKTRIGLLEQQLDRADVTEVA